MIFTYLGWRRCGGTFETLASEGIVPLRQRYVTVHMIVWWLTCNGAVVMVVTEVVCKMR